MPVYQEFIRNTYNTQNSQGNQVVTLTTQDDDHQVRAGQADQVVVHSCVEVGAADDHVTHREVADDSSHEDDQVEDCYHDESVGVLHLLWPEYNQKILLSEIKLPFLPLS